MRGWPYPRWIAHRGAGKLAPENTLAAFRLGARYGYRAFECDVKLSADGLPFLLHDATLERTSNGVGAAGEQRWHELSQLDAGGWHSRAYAGEPLPSLRGVAAFVQRNGFALDLEIKPSPGTDSHTGAVVATEVARRWHGQARAAAQFISPTRCAPRATPPRTAARAAAGPAARRCVDAAGALGCVAVITDHKLMDAALITRLHGSGLRALVYTVNEPERAQQLLAIGIDGIVTDAVDRFVPD
jgi:glycerophosphoryl diester phosphodiesterase